MAMYVILIVFVTTILWLLFTPIIIEVNTRYSKYKIHLFGIGSVFLNISPSMDVDLIIRLLGWKWRKNLFTPGKIKKTVTVKKLKSHRYRFWKGSLKKPLRFMKAFRLRYFKMDLDTGDEIINAYLFPLFGLLRRKGYKFNINFEGNVEVAFMIQSSLAKMIYRFYV